VPGCDLCPSRDAVIAAQARAIGDLQEKVARLERLLSRNSGNSSMPPSSDDLPGRRPSRQQRRAAERAGRKRGKQPGALGSAMAWAEPDEVTGYQSSPRRASDQAQVRAGAERATVRYQ
jgi:transposase